MCKEEELQKTKKPTMALLKPVKGRERKKGKAPCSRSNHLAQTPTAAAPSSALEIV